jgi:transposase
MFSQRYSSFRFYLLSLNWNQKNPLWYLEFKREKGQKVMSDVKFFNVYLKFKRMRTNQMFIKQSVGIDVSKDTLDVSICCLNNHIEICNIAQATFENSKKGVIGLENWIRNHSIKDLDYTVVVEATGIYHETLAYHLYEKNIKIAIVLPSKISAYFKSTNKRSINDKISACLIAEFGLMRKLDTWTPPSPCLRKLKVLVRERLRLIEMRTMVKNNEHVYKYAANTTGTAQERICELKNMLNKQIKEIEEEIRVILSENPELYEKVKRICTIKGVSLITVVTIVAETNGFSLIRNARQLVCYAGYDIVKKESGTSVRKGGNISHRGNKNIRRALYFPAITAQQNNTFFSNFYDRLYNRHSIKMKAYVAVQRKLLILIYTLWKNNEEYNPEKHKTYKFLEQPNQAALIELDHCPLFVD